MHPRFEHWSRIVQQDLIVLYRKKYAASQVGTSTNYKILIHQLNANLSLILNKGDAVAVCQNDGVTTLLKKPLVLVFLVILTTIRHSLSQVREIE